VYAGLAPIGQLSAPQLGAAAGFEAYRHWRVYGSAYRPVLGGDEEHEREALAGMAAGETHRLIRYIMVGQRRHFMREASEVAIATALKLHEENFDSDLGNAYAYDAQPFRTGRGHLGGHSRPGMLRRRSSFAYGDGLDNERRAEKVGRQGSGVTYISPQVTGGVIRQQPTYIVAGGQQQQPISYVPATGAQQQVRYVQAGGGVGGQGQAQYVVYPGQQQQQQQQLVQQQQLLQQQQLMQQQQQQQQQQYIQQQPQYVPGGQQIQYVATGAQQQPLQYAAQQPQYVNAAGFGGAGYGTGAGLGMQPQYIQSPASPQMGYPGQQQFVGGGGGGLGYGGRMGRSRAMSVSSPAGGYVY